jgi:hypothetical protein
MFVGGNFPKLIVIAPAIAPPMRKPCANACRMFRTCSRSLWMNDRRTESSYEARAPGVQGVRPGCKAAKAASAASRPDSIA